MADTKISGLPADTLTGVEEIPVADTGSSKKATINDVRNFTLNDAGSGLFAGKSIRWLKRGEATVTSTATTPEQTLMTFTVPAGLLAANFDILVFEMCFTFATNANTKQIRIKFGATTIMDSTAIAHNALRACVRGYVKRQTATTQQSYALAVESANNQAWSGTITGSEASATPGETLSGAVTFQVTVQQSAASADTIMDSFLIGYLPA